MSTFKLISWYVQNMQDDMVFAGLRCCVHYFYVLNNVKTIGECVLTSRRGRIRLAQQDLKKLACSIEPETEKAAEWQLIAYFEDSEKMGYFLLNKNVIAYENWSKNTYYCTYQPNNK